MSRVSVPGSVWTRVDSREVLARCENGGPLLQIGWDFDPHGFRSGNSGRIIGKAKGVGPFRTVMLSREIKATIALATPVVATQVAQISMGFVDTVMVGHLSSMALAGIALGNSIFFTTIVIAMGVVMAVGPMVSQAFGAGDDSGLARSVRQGLWLAAILTVPSMLIVRNAGVLLTWMGQDAETVSLSQAYLRAISWGAFPFLGFVALRSFIEGVSRPRPATVISFAAVGLNILANYVLMYGKLGFPALGLVGTGWASSLVFWFMLIALVFVTQLSPTFAAYGVFRHIRRPDPRYLAEIFRIGWPIGISYGVESGLFLITALMMGLLGTVALAAHQVAIQCAAFTFMVPLGIGIATSVRVGQAVGRQDSEGATTAGFVGIGIAAVFMLFAATLFWIMPRAIVGLYLDLADPANAEVIRLAAALLVVAAVFQIFDGIQVSAAGALRGLKDTRVPMLIGFVSYWVFGFDRGPIGLWWGLVLGLVAAAVLLSIRFGIRARARFEDVVPVAHSGK
jgi:MATE family multidrug resistance protein